MSSQPSPRTTPHARWRQRKNGASSQATVTKLHLALDLERAAVDEQMQAQNVEIINSPAPIALGPVTEPAEEQIDVEDLRRLHEERTADEHRRLEHDRLDDHRQRQVDRHRLRIQQTRSHDQ